jgi:hypothetical protein
MPAEGQLSVDASEAKPLRHDSHGAEATDSSRRDGDETQRITLNTGGERASRSCNNLPQGSQASISYGMVPPMVPFTSTSALRCAAHGAVDARQ